MPKRPNNTIPYNFQLRSYQREVFDALADGYRFLYLVWPRRSGKDKLCLNAAIWYAARHPGILAVFVGPYSVQARRIYWSGRDDGGQPFLLHHVPPGLIKGTNEAEMSIELTNGSRIQVIGGDNIDRVVGINPRFLVFTEWSLQDRNNWDLMQPIIRANKGTVHFNLTPRGANHAFDMFNTAVQYTDRWFVSYKTSNSPDTLLRDAQGEDGSPIFTQQDIDDAIAEGMAPELVDQEFHCSWSGYREGSYFGKQMASLRESGRITTVPWNPDRQVFTAWDLGISDSNSIIFAQIDSSGVVNIIDMIEDRGRSMAS